MESEKRKQRFVELLEEIVYSECNGVKAKLAKKLQLKATLLTAWFQGKIDPGSIEILAFSRLAEVKGCSTDDLAQNLLIDVDKLEPQVDSFRQLIEDLLQKQSQDQLGKQIGVSQNAISRWINPEINIDPSKIPTERIAALAKAKGWTIERLLIYLGLKEPQTEKDLFFKLRLSLSLLSFDEQIQLLTWLSNLLEQQLLENKIINKTIQSKTNNRTVDFHDCSICIILEKEDLAIATNYASNLVLHLNLKPENIKVTTISNLPESIANIDILILDISTSSSASIALIEDIEFDRDIVVFIDADLSTEVRSSLEDKVTDVILKPIDWQMLKDKAYFI